MSCTFSALEIPFMSLNRRRCLGVCGTISLFCERNHSLQFGQSQMPPNGYCHPPGTHQHPLRPALGTTCQHQERVFGTIVPAVIYLTSDGNTPWGPLGCAVWVAWETTDSVLAMRCCSSLSILSPRPQKRLPSKAVIHRDSGS